MEKQWTAVDDYIDRTLGVSDPILEAAVKASEDAGLPSIQVAPNQGKLLYLLAAIAHARNILEIGTLGGYSAIWLGRALPADGKLITLELSPNHAQVARANIDRAGLRDRVEVRVGPALDSLKDLASEHRTFDLIFIDADKTGYPDYLQWSLKVSHPGTVFVIDNVVRDGEIANAKSSDASVQAVRRMNEMLGRDPRLNATILQTVGVKGYDGLAVAIVTG
ncbi:MAG TPA: O-methyltransferase [Thermoanaerobaculia bacterium]